MIFFRGMLVDIEKLISFNDKWRKKEAESLQKLVQRRIEYAQVFVYAVQDAIYYASAKPLTL